MNPNLHNEIDKWVGRFREVGFVSEFIDEMRPDRDLVVFRGAPKGWGHGMAWTTSAKVANSFALRQTQYPHPDNSLPGLIWRAMVRSDSVLALIYQRDESEVVVDPAGLYSIEPTT